MRADLLLDSEVEHLKLSQRIISAKIVRAEYELARVPVGSLEERHLLGDREQLELAHESLERIVT